MYPKSFINYLINTIKISDVIGRCINLKKNGKDYVACCPFHSEKTPSFSVSDEKQIFHCFGCGKGGNIITFVMEYERKTFSEAVEYLANLYGIPIDKKKNNIKIKEELNEIETIYKINEEACKFFENNLLKSDGINYAIRRGFNQDSIKKYRIGFAINNYSSLMNYLKSKNYSEKIIEKSGLIANGNNGYYDKFRNRLMFPVFDNKGRVIAFSGRILGDGKPKYMNSPETKIFKKGEILFNFFFAKKTINETNSVILVEGNIDSLTLSMNGFENTVAPMGTAINQNQILELWKNADNIYVCLDGDSAGQNAIYRLVIKIFPIMTIGKNIKIVLLPNDMDPDDFIKKNGKEEFQKLLDSSISLSDYLWNIEVKKLNINLKKSIIPEQKAILEKKLFDIIKTIKDVKLKKYFEQFYKNKLWALNKLDFKKDNKNNIDINIQDIIKYDINDLIAKNESDIIQIICNFPETISELKKKYNINMYDIQFLNENLFEILSIIKNQKNVSNELVKMELKNYISSTSFIIDNNKSLQKLYILLLKREEILIKLKIEKCRNTNCFDDFNALNSELLSIKKIIESEFVNNEFI